LNSPQQDHLFYILKIAWSVTWNFATGSYTGVEDEFVNLPKEFALRQNYPNPFNPATKIQFQIPRSSDVRIEIFNTLGQKVDILVDRYMQAGFYELEYNAQNLAGGIYFYMIQTGDFKDVKKMILLR